MSIKVKCVSSASQSRLQLNLLKNFCFRGGPHSWDGGHDGRDDRLIVGLALEQLNGGLRGGRDVPGPSHSFLPFNHRFSPLFLSSYSLSFFSSFFLVWKTDIMICFSNIISNSH